MKKIWQAQSFGYYLVGGALLLGIFLVTPLRRDAEMIEAERLDTYSMLRQEELIEFIRDQAKQADG